MQSQHRHLQLQQEVPLLLLRFSPQRGIRIAKTGEIISSTRLCSCSLCLKAPRMMHEMWCDESMQNQNHRRS
jgi:hypothetical protein